MPPKLLEERVIAQGCSERTDPAALVVGPTGVALGNNGTLYVADTVRNRIAAIPEAAVRRVPVNDCGMTVTDNGNLNGPLGLTLAPNGDLLAANGGNGNIVEITPSGSQVAVVTADDASVPGGGGVLFGLVVSPFNNHLYFVDDGMNTIGVYTPN
jgi:sugar lactone lactonase YvrE